MHFDGSNRSKCTAGDNIVRLRSGFWLYLAIQTPLCQHFPNMRAYVCVCHPDFCDCYLYSIQTVGAHSSLISACQSHDAKGCVFLTQAGREGGRMTNTHLCWQPLLCSLKGQCLTGNFNINTVTNSHTETSEKQSVTDILKQKAKIPLSVWPGIWKTSLTPWYTDPYIKRSCISHFPLW